MRPCRRSSASTERPAEGTTPNRGFPPDPGREDPISAARSRKSDPIRGIFPLFFDTISPETEGHRPHSNRSSWPTHKSFSKKKSKALVPKQMSSKYALVMPGTSLFPKAKPTRQAARTFALRELKMWARCPRLLEDTGEPPMPLLEEAESSFQHLSVSAFWRLFPSR